MNIVYEHNQWRLIGMTNPSLEYCWQEFLPNKAQSDY